MSRIRTNLITNRMANGAPTVSNGLVISGVTTVTTLDLNGDLDVDGHLNADNVSIAGVCTATSFVGSGANLTSLPAQATIANNADNRIITGGSGVNLNAESNVLYDGTNFGIGKSPSRTLDVQGKIRSSDSVCFGDNSSTPSEGAAIHRPAASSLAFVTNNTERFRIDSSGRVGIKFTGNYTMNSASTNLVIGDGGSGVGMTFWTASGADNQTISFQTNETLSRAEGEISYGPTGTSTAADRNAMMFRTNSAERLRISSSGKVGINSTSPQQALDVKGSINGGSVNQPFLRFHDSHGRQRNTKHYFKCVKGGTTIFDILTVDLNQNFHQALIILHYGARIQNVSDSVTYPVHKIIGVNRFNGGSIQFTKNTIVQDSNASTHADIDAVATSSTNYRIRLTYSGTAGGSSFCCGSVEIIGVGSGDDGCFYSLAHAHGLVA